MPDIDSNKCSKRYMPDGNRGEWVQDHMEHKIKAVTDEFGMTTGICQWCGGKIYPKNTYA